MLSRRGLLRGLAPGAAALSCRSQQRAEAPAVRFVGQNPARGHLVRDPAGDAVPSETVSADVVVIGAGAAGAAAAWRLARAGLKDVHLLELEDGVGGTARSGNLDRSAFPMGAHYLPSPRPGFTGLVALLRELGVVTGRESDGTLRFDSRVVTRAPMERHHHRGIWSPGLYPAAGETDGERAQWERFVAHLRGLDRRGTDGRRLFDLPVVRSSVDLRHLDKISMATYLDRHGFTSWRLRWVVDYACRDDYGARLEETSAFAGLHHFLGRGLEEDRDGQILSWARGNAPLVDGMLERADLRDRLHTGTVVRSIDPQTGRVVAIDVATGVDRAFMAQVILWAAPRFVLPFVLPPGADPVARGTLPYAPWLVAGISLERPPAGFGAPLSWDNVSIEADHLGYVVANHGEPLTALARPGCVISYYEPFAPADRGQLLRADADALAARAVAALEAMHPGVGRTVGEIHVARWGHGMIRPEPGLLFGEALAAAREPIGRVVPCASDTAGLALFEEAFAAGVGAAEWALMRLGREESSIL